jgi:DNA repair protein RecO (recombination protein O)
MYNTNGIVIRVSPYGENSRVLTILTERGNTLTATVRGSSKISSQNIGGTQLFAYSSFSFDRKKDWYYLRSSEPLHTFYGLRDDLKKLALASYFLQILLECVTEEEEAPELIRLVLNSLHFLETGKRQSAALLKSIFELRFLSETGFTPDVLACAVCGEYLPEDIRFLMKSGNFVCKTCLSKLKQGSILGEDIFHMSGACLHAVRYIVLSDIEKIFAFRLSKTCENELAAFSEKFISWRLSKNFTALDFYRKVSPVE